jgi:electron transport complex protein RnfA
MFVILGASILSYLLYHFVLDPLDIEYMNLISFILVIASFVQFTEMFIKKYSPSLYKSLGIYLPLITTNCAVLYVALANITSGYDFMEMITYSIAVPFGFMLVLIIFSYSEKLDIAPIPKAFKGNPVALIVAALMAIAFSGLAGLV